MGGAVAVALTNHRYFVEGVEGSLCSDAPPKIWYVICGFAAVSVSLFVVAVSFRLLLQQKEVRLVFCWFEEKDLTRFLLNYHYYIMLVD